MNASAGWQPAAVSPASIGSGDAIEDLLAYLGDRTRLEHLLAANGAVILRGFAVTEERLPAVIDLALDKTMSYTGGNSPRTAVREHLYTSTEYPAQHLISMHNELSYLRNWPSRLLFYCAQPSRIGGQTPVVRGADWLGGIDPAVREALAPGLLYTQDLHGGVGLGRSWQDTFETGDRDAVETTLRGWRTSWRWLHDGSLRIQYQRPSTISHPVTGVEVWFSQVDQWHASYQSEVLGLADTDLEVELPQSVSLVDGSPIPTAYVRHIAEVGLRLAVDVVWRQGDLLIIDNVLVAHGRRPFTGPRRILVAMSG